MRGVVSFLGFFVLISFSSFGRACSVLFCGFRVCAVLWCMGEVLTCMLECVLKCYVEVLRRCVMISAKVVWRSWGY